MKVDKPLVAVITRTKDRPVLLRRAIESVHSQTEKNFIHVIINDAGDRASVDDVVAEYAETIVDKIKVIHNELSHGMEAASNSAIKSVESQFIAIHDDDDTWHPEFLKMTTELMVEKDAMGVAVRTSKVTESLGDDGNVRTLKKRDMDAGSKICDYISAVYRQPNDTDYIYI